MSKRPGIDLLALTSEAAVSMPEAAQRSALQPRPPAAPNTLASSAPAHHTAGVAASEAARVRTENLEALAFKVPPAFRKRFRTRAAEANLKLNELLFEALDVWEAHQGLTKNRRG